jgi:apolipoprotein N-acyltransferase
MSVFRAVENKRSVVRATASGQTCGIDPNGKIIAMAKQFTEAQLTVSVPIADEKTFYTKRGDFLPILFLIFSVISLAIGLIKHILEKTRKV